MILDRLTNGVVHIPVIGLLHTVPVYKSIGLSNLFEIGTSLGRVSTVLINDE